ncbi:MAG: hypothetical protein ACUVWX_05185, partial [Kiritimatiellia bacterium]
MGKRLYVWNLYFKSMERDFRELFAQVGNVTSCDLVTDK